MPAPAQPSTLNSRLGARVDSGLRWPIDHLILPISELVEALREELRTEAEAGPRAPDRLPGRYRLGAETVRRAVNKPCATCAAAPTSTYQDGSPKYDCGPPQAFPIGPSGERITA